VTSRSLIMAYDGRSRRVSPSPFANGLANPRRLLVLPNGDVLGYISAVAGAEGRGCLGIPPGRPIGPDSANGSTAVYLKVFPCGLPTPVQRS
jgi:hypothetical protein